MKRTTMLLPDVLVGRLKAEAKEKETTVTAIIRRVLEDRYDELGENSEP